MESCHELYEKRNRRPFKSVGEERGMRNWWEYQQKSVNARMLKPERMEKFKELLEVGEKYRRVNQYV